jgi:hypothetical protein
MATHTGARGTRLCRLEGSKFVEDVKNPGEPAPTGSGLIRTLTLVASALTTASIAVNLILQVARFLRKRPMQPGQRDRLEAASLGLTVLRTMPGLIKQVRLLANQIRGMT